MPKCLVCHKQGIFLKLTNGLCHKCLDTAQRQIIAANAARALTSVNRAAQPAIPAAERKLTYNEKELLAVQRTTLQDLKSLVNFPYVWNCRLEKFIQPNAHPFVFMDIVGPNLAAAKRELAKLNFFIEASKDICKKLPKSLSIPVDKIVFNRFASMSYTRLICTPITYNGKPANLPLTLSFFTDMEKADTTHGDLVYGRGGIFEKASVYFWRRGTGYFLYFTTHHNNFILQKIECSDYLNEQCRPLPIYEAPYLIERREQLAKDETDFPWIQANLPSLCPKNISSYRRMKTQNTKNYQALKQAAAELGYMLP